MIGSPYTITPCAAVGTGLGNYTIRYLGGMLTVTLPPPVTLANIRSVTNKKHLVT